MASLTASSTLLALVTLATPALAADDVPPSAADDTAAHGLVGLGVASIPDTPGGGDQRTVILPVLNVRFTQVPFYLGNPFGGTPLQAGMALPVGAHWTFGAALSAQANDPREATDAQRAAGVEDIDRAGMGSVFARWAADGFSATLTATRSMGDSDQGKTATLRLQRTFQPNPRLRLTLGPSATWSDGEHMRTWYGVPIGSARYAAYDPAGGLEEIALNLGASIALSPQWIVGSGLQLAQLHGHARDSPLVEDDTPLRMSLFVARRF